jgi:hypothetical protein
LDADGSCQLIERVARRSSTGRRCCAALRLLLRCRPRGATRDGRSPAALTSGDRSRVGIRQYLAVNYQDHLSGISPSTHYLLVWPAQRGAQGLYIARFHMNKILKENTSHIAQDATRQFTPNKRARNELYMRNKALGLPTQPERQMKSAGEESCKLAA